MTDKRRKKKRPLPFRERLFRFWRELRAGWPLYLGMVVYCAVLLLTAIDPLVDPFMPERGKNLILAAIPNSYRLLEGGLWQYALFAMVWLPWGALLLWLPRLPRWLREQREWERKAVIRRARDKERRARRRAEREASIVSGGSNAANQSRSSETAFTCALVLLLTACASQIDAGVSAEATAPGFWWGLWHGFIFPFAWIGSLFRPDIAVYAVPNSGGWYDFWFFLGITVLGGGSFFGSRKRD